VFFFKEQTHTQHKKKMFETEQKINTDKQTKNNHKKLNTHITI